MFLGNAGGKIYKSNVIDIFKEGTKVLRKN